eukprot:1317828-Rhodomonas_salina.4
MSAKKLGCKVASYSPAMPCPLLTFEYEMCGTALAYAGTGISVRCCCAMVCGIDAGVCHCCAMRRDSCPSAALR